MKCTSNEIETTIHDESWSKQTERFESVEIFVKVWVNSKLQLELNEQQNNTQVSLEISGGDEDRNNNDDDFTKHNG